MNHKLLGFFSGFPTHHFPVDIARWLREELTIRDSLVFVSAWLSDYERNDSDSVGMHGMFAECNMPFKQYCVIDNRTDTFDAKRLIREASCIFLMGGHAVQQFQLICEKGIFEEIRKSFAVILGVSAGSSNMAKRSLDIWESLVPYDGLGLADITIKAHITQENQELLQTLLQISVEQNLPIIFGDIGTNDGKIDFKSFLSIFYMDYLLLNRNIKWTYAALCIMLYLINIISFERENHYEDRKSSTIGGRRSRSLFYRGSFRETGGKFLRCSQR